MSQAPRHTVTFSEDGSYEIDEHPENEVECSFDARLADQSTRTPPPGAGTWYSWILSNTLSWERVEVEADG